MNVLLCGGGVDSCTLMVWLKNKGVDFTVLHVNYGQKAFVREANAVKYFCDKYGIKVIKGDVNLNPFSTCSILGSSNLSVDGNTKLELRNFSLIAYASVLVASNGGGTIYLGYHAEPDHIPYPDAIFAWAKKLEPIMKEGSGIDVNIDAPFKDITREHIYGLAYGMDSDIITKSYTCYDYNECGICPHCVLKRQLIEKLRLKL